jgi:hypothetical protein
MMDLNHDLDLLADEAEPADVDVYDVIAKAKARTRNRRATVATTLSVVTVAGAMIATIGLGGQPSTQAGSRSTTPPVTDWSPPAGSTMTSHAVEDDQMVKFTEQLAEAWPSIVPRGVTTEKLDWFASGTLGPLEFRGFRTEIPPNSITYAAAAKLSGSQGAIELVIHVTQVGPTDWPFASYSQTVTNNGQKHTFTITPSPHGDPYTLPDGTRIRTWAQGTPPFQQVTEVVRPDGTAIWITENNQTGQPDLFLSKDAVLKLATALSYS